MTNAVVRCLREKSSALEAYSRSKAEQVLAAICLNMLSFEPVTRLIGMPEEEGSANDVNVHIYIYAQCYRRMFVPIVAINVTDHPGMSAEYL